MKSEAQKLANQKYRVKNKERLRIYNREKQREWREKNPERHKKVQEKYKLENPNYSVNKQRARFRKYGLSLEEGLNILSTGCSICGTMENLCIDHCHKSGIVRGCLCDKHNCALGYLSESPRETLAMYSYIVNRCGSISQLSKGF